MHLKVIKNVFKTPSPNCRLSNTAFSQIHYFETDLRNKRTSLEHSSAPTVPSSV